MLPPTRRVQFGRRKKLPKCASSQDRFLRFTNSGDVRLTSDFSPETSLTPSLVATGNMQCLCRHGPPPANRSHCHSGRPVHLTSHVLAEAFHAVEPASGKDKQEELCPNKRQEKVRRESTRRVAIAVVVNKLLACGPWWSRLRLTQHFCCASSSAELKNPSH